MSLTTPNRLRSLFTTGIAVAVIGTAAACSPAEDSPPTPWAPTPTSSSPASPPKSSKSQPSDYSHLLLQAEDVSIPPDTFTARSSNVNPDGQSGASALFVNTDDTRAIADTILIYPDAETASATLKQASAAVSTMVTGGPPQPVPIGSNGSVISGMAPDGSKAVTLLMYTQGRAVVRLEFDSNPDDPVSPQTVASVGRMQQIALRIGLPERE
ncbi:hypothetical protein A5731_18965 [Mycolicibacterium conceptionense]|uniref:Lipoprotein LpqN n=2 Tax=Mycolicibacterium TaxID=1866885 RepID=A0A0U1DXV5_9MYCO|nr:MULTISPECIES: hypothetical protein [Mycolicibacterium]MCW1823540.1 hypothetical protein [Mycolicibacterium senegalense]OBB05793.1 hypothetical protein A5718_01195 [Mycolicibacterium conceptionense]OBF01218.1 hypothetical protein A5731_18965 [Mycolicibacterium conceptionense]OBF29985.1 hypothetical protein A5726_29700 [Mycolicibacterium conceptionense]OBF32507.1 hypothetical protein A5720_26710 [Mycolicibacterium conceptionense]